MSVITCGINHKSAPISLRERLAISPDQHNFLLQDLKQSLAADEAVLLSTCNRTEIYCAGIVDDSILQWLANRHDLPLQQIRDHFYIHHADDAVRHSMRVACGLDSMMLGEPQILGQMKQAVATAKQVGCIGNRLQRLFDHVFAASKKVRSQTAIGVNPVSIAYAGVSLIKRQYADLASQKILLIGAGETITLVARHLLSQGAKHFWVANRTLERAEILAGEVDGQAMTIGDIADALPQVDVVVTATACPVPFIGKGSIESALKLRQQRPIFMLDLAVPRDIEPEVADLKPISLYNVDDLQNIVESGLQQRQDAAEQAEAIIEQELIAYIKQQKAFSANVAIANYRQQMQFVADQELQQALQALNQGQSAEEAMQLLQYRLTNKLLHQPSKRLRQAGIEGRDDLLELAELMFVNEVN